MQNIPHILAMYIYIYRHKVPHEAVVSHSVQVFFPSKKVFPCMLTSLHLQDDVLLNGDLPIIFRCYVWFCLHKKEKYVKHDKKNTNKYKKKYSRIFHIFQIYTGYASIKGKMFWNITKTKSMKHSRIFRIFQIYTSYAAIKWQIV